MRNMSNNYPCYTGYDIQIPGELRYMHCNTGSYLSILSPELPSGLRQQVDFLVETRAEREQGFGLTVEVEPADATVKILNIKPRYRAGMKLKPGRYEVQVTRDGYKARRQWVEIGDGDRVVSIRLEKLAHSLTVTTTPSNATVQFIGLERSYRHGMELTPGWYEVEVSSKGYNSQRKRFEIEAEPKRVVVVLQKQQVRKNYEPEMVAVAGGCFQMGSDSGRSNEKPVHRVCLDGFSMGKYEVTQGQWRAVMGSNPSNSSCGDNCPVKKVSWDDIQGYIKKLNRQTGKRYRLPTEAEW